MCGRRGRRGLADRGLPARRSAAARRADHRATRRETLDELIASVRQPVLWLLVAFLVLWNFTPLSMTVVYLHWTRTLGFDEVFYGHTVDLAGGRRDDGQPGLWAVLPARLAVGADAHVDRAGDRGDLGLLDWSSTEARPASSRRWSDSPT